MIKGYLTLKEASELSGINIEALKKRCQEGKIRGALKKGNGWFVPQGEIVVNEDNTFDGSMGLLITMVEAGGVGAVTFGVTLFVNGSLISGTLVSRETYLTKFEKDITSNLNFGDFEGAQELKEQINNTVSTYVGSLMGKDEQGTPTFIHMIDVNVFNDGSTPLVLKPANLRIRLSAVNGFMLGSIDHKDGHQP